MMENDYSIKGVKYSSSSISSDKEGLGRDDDFSEDDYSTSGSRMLRGPGQKATNPFQFVATKGGEELAEAAKTTLQVAQQQKIQRDKILQGQRQQPKFDDSEPWQADLDTWRRKRKEKIVDSPTPTKEGVNEEIDSYMPNRKAKDEILHINSNPRQHSNASSTISPLRSSNDDLNTDSGIDNRTVESPSTSEFSPRSTDLFASPKSLPDEEPPHHPPPPIPAAPSQKLDQVLVPLKYSKHQEYSPIYRSVETKHYYDQIKPEDKDTTFIETSRTIENQAYMPITNARVEATFKQPPPREGVKPFVSRAAQELDQIRNNNRESENIDLTVELNREQKATVTATKYPRNNDFVQEMPYHHNDYRQYNQSATLAPQSRSSSTTRIYHAVDIPFDESPATYIPPRGNSSVSDRKREDTEVYYSNSKFHDAFFTLNIAMGSQPVHKGLGFTTIRKDERVTVESVIVGSPADRAGLLVGDTIISINGEDMSDKYQSGVSRILHEAARVGEADVLILRAPVPTPLLNKQYSTSSSSTNSNFDKARSVFTENKSFDSYAEFKRKHSRASRDSGSSRESRSSRDYNSLPRATTVNHDKMSNPSSLDRKRDTSLSSYRTARENFNNTSMSTRSSARSDRSAPDYGDYRVTSFQEKNQPGKLTDFVPEADRRMSRLDHEEVRYRNGDETPKTIRNYHLSNENIAKTNTNYESRRDSVEESTTATLKRSTLPRSGGHWKSDYEEDENDDDETTEKVGVRNTSPLRSALKKTSHNYPPPPPLKKYYSTDSLIKPQQSTRHIRQEYSSSSEDELETEERFFTSNSMSRRRQIPIQTQTPRRYQNQDESEFHTVGSYGNGGRSRSANSRRQDTTYDTVSDVSHRFYDRDGNHVRIPRERSTEVEIRREYGNNKKDLEFTRSTYQWDREETYHEESRDWRDVINMQRQAAPGHSADRRGIVATSSSLSNLPNYINRRMEQQQQQQLVKEPRELVYLQPAPAPVTEHYERDEYSRVEERNYQQPTPVQRTSMSNSNSAMMKREETQVQQQSKRNQEQDNVVAVSGKHKCAHCSEELGRGAAMIVESLNLFYHLACFKCYVCKTSLGSGVTGADVRVRDGRLHCQTCYSNDRVQLSKV